MIGSFTESSMMKEEPFGVEGSNIDLVKRVSTDTRETG